MQKSVVLLVAMIPLMVVLSATPTRAQTDLPSWTFLRDGSGDVWVVVDGVRIGIPIYPASDEQVNAIPFSGTWIGQADADGKPTALTSRPDWGGSTGIVAAPVVAPATKPNSAPLAPEEAVNFNGTTDTVSRPFKLRGGTYRIGWEAKRAKREDYFCSMWGALRADWGTTYGSFGSPSTNLVTGKSGEVYVTNIVGGTYQLSLNSGCAWTVTISPG